MAEGGKTCEEGIKLKRSRRQHAVFAIASLSARAGISGRVHIASIAKMVSHRRPGGGISYQSMAAPWRKRRKSSSLSAEDLARHLIIGLRTSPTKYATEEDAYAQRRQARRSNVRQQLERGGAGCLGGASERKAALPGISANVAAGGRSASPAMSSCCGAGVCGDHRAYHLTLLVTLALSMRVCGAAGGFSVAMEEIKGRSIYLAPWRGALSAACSVSLAACGTGAAKRRRCACAQQPCAAAAAGAMLRVLRNAMAPAYLPL
jgi:hypothetical protein